MEKPSVGALVTCGKTSTNYRSLKRTFEDLLLRCCYAIETKSTTIR